MYGKATNLKAWITTVPNKMNKAEKMRDKSGIISRLHVIEGVLVQQETSVFCIICPSKGWRVKKCLPTSCYAEYRQLLQSGNHKMHRSIGLQTSVECEYLYIEWQDWWFTVYVYSTYYLH